MKTTIIMKNGRPYVKGLSCPECHGGLILRKNKKTEQNFYGCENFPKCKYSCATWEDLEKQGVEADAWAWSGNVPKF